MALTKDDLVQMNDVVYGAITKFYQKVIAPKMATKDDLAEIRNQMATKDDIKNMATKDDLAKLATKDDLAKVEESLGKRIDKVAEVVTMTKTNHERRIRKLEGEVGVEPTGRLVA